MSGRAPPGRHTLPVHHAESHPKGIGISEELLPHAVRRVALLQPQGGGAARQRETRNGGAGVCHRHLTHRRLYRRGIAGGEPQDTATDGFPECALPVPLQHHHGLYGIQGQQVSLPGMASFGQPGHEGHDHDGAPRRHRCPRQRRAPICAVGHDPRLRPRQRLPVGAVLQVGRQGPHPASGPHRAHEKSTLGGMVLHLVPRYGTPVAGRQHGQVRQPSRAIAHFLAGMEQDHLLRTVAAS